MIFAAIIPARGGSVRVPRKNLAVVGASSLVGHAIGSAFGMAAYVSTDDPEIAAVARRHRVHVHDRPAGISKGIPGPGGRCSTELVIDHWWAGLAEKPDAFVLLQPTSPMRTATHVREACALLESSGADSVCSVVRNPRGPFAGRAYPRDGWTQFRPFRPEGHRPRSQDARVILEENGAIYVTRRGAWKRTGDRMGGTVAAYEMSISDSIDVDTMEDLEAAREAWRRREAA